MSLFVEKGRRDPATERRRETCLPAGRFEPLIPFAGLTVFPAPLLPK